MLSRLLAPAVAGACLSLAALALALPAVRPAAAADLWWTPGATGTISSAPLCADVGGAIESLRRMVEARANGVSPDAYFQRLGTIDCMRFSGEATYLGAVPHLSIIVGEVEYVVGRWRTPAAREAYGFIMASLVAGGEPA